MSKSEVLLCEVRQEPDVEVLAHQGGPALQVLFQPVLPAFHGRHPRSSTGTCGLVWDLCEPELVPLDPVEVLLALVLLRIRGGSSNFAELHHFAHEEGHLGRDQGERRVPFLGAGLTQGLEELSLNFRVRVHVLLFFLFLFILLLARAGGGLCVDGEFLQRRPGGDHHRYPSTSGIILHEVEQRLRPSSSRGVAGILEELRRATRDRRIVVVASAKVGRSGALSLGLTTSKSPGPQRHAGAGVYCLLGRSQ